MYVGGSCEKVRRHHPMSSHSYTYSNQLFVLRNFILFLHCKPKVLHHPTGSDHIACSGATTCHDKRLFRYDITSCSVGSSNLAMAAALSPESPLKSRVLASLEVPPRPHLVACFCFFLPLVGSGLL